MSSRFVTRRSRRRALPAIRPARSRESASSSCTSPRSSVIARPRIAARGVRRSCETACRNVFFISSSERSRCVASRSTASARSSCAWDSLRSVTSSRNPCQYGGFPGSSTWRASSCTHTIRPSFAIIRYSIEKWPSPVMLLSASAESTRSRSSGWMIDRQSVGSALDVLERVADQVGVPRCDVGGERDRRILGVDLLGVEDRLVLLHDRAELQLCVAEPFLRRFPLGDVDQESLPEALLVGLGHERGLVVHPDPCAVGVTESVVERVRLLRLVGAVVDVVHEGLVIDVDPVSPEVRASRSRPRVCSRRDPRPGG